MNGKQLKNSILQWAIQGKLVPQNPNDEPASVLLERIRAEKAKLIKEKKIKKDKNESIIYRGDDNSYYEKFLATGEVKCIDEEIPFEIPTTWEWVRLNSYSDVRDGTHDTPHYVTCGYPLVTSKDFISGKFDFSKTKYIDEQTFVEINKRSNVQIGDILFSMIGGNIGSMILITRENYFDMAIKNVALFKQYIYDEIIIKYLCFYLQSQIISIKSTALGGAQSFVPLNILRNYLMPIPPLSEQQRIVSKLEEILPLVETYERSQNELNSLNAIIYEQLRKSILQEAIQGKLVPQISEEGTGKELLTEIHKEKERLVKESKLKKSALTYSVIFKGDDNKYYEQINGQAVQIECDYDFPYSWSLVRLSSICSLIDGEKKEGQQLCLDAKFLRGKSAGEYQQRGKFVHKGDNIILVDGENSGEVFTVPCDGYMGSTFKQLWVSSAMHLPYVLNFILFYKELLRKSKRGAAIPHLNKEIFYSLIIGIPPYQEQMRIVNRINEIYSKIKG